VARNKKSKIDPDPSYRWCDKQDKYIPVSACKEKTKVKARCRKCYQDWDRTRYQMPLPIKIAEDRKQLK
jgi:hypothetical protein